MNIPRLMPSKTDAGLFDSDSIPSSAFVYVNDMLPLYEEVFTEVSLLHVCVTTFNVACKKPALPLTGIAAMQNTKTGQPTDVIALAFQEVDMSASALLREETEASQPWIAAANEAIGANSQPRVDSRMPYFALPPKQMVGLLLCVYVRRELIPCVREFNIALVPTGALGSVGNKGAVGLRLVIHRTSICFLSAHLAAGQNSVSQRNASIETILTSMDFNAFKRAEYEQLQGNAAVNTMSLLPPIRLRDQDIVVIAGDLNYRVNLTYNQSFALTTRGKYSSLLLYDQLIAEMKNPHTPWWGFKDLTPTFPPTYRFDIGTSVYDTSEKRRIPGYTDRFCVYMKDPNMMQHLEVDSMEALMNVKSSDHKPVVACLRLPVRTEIIAKREALEASLKQQYETKDELFRTETEISCNLVEFGTIQIYRHTPSQVVTIRNTGKVAAPIRVVRLKDAADITSGTWLRVFPTELVVLPGKSKNVTISTCIDPSYCSWLASYKPFEKKGQLTLISPLQFVVRASKCHTVICSASLLPSVFGNRLDYIYTMGTKVCSEAYVLGSMNNNSEVAPHIPKELWFMADVLFRFPHQPGLFTQTVDNVAVEAMMQHLDTSCTPLPVECGYSAVVVGECLLTFLRQLQDPVIPRNQYVNALSAIKAKGDAPLLFVQALTAVHANTFVYIMSLLQYLLRSEHAEHNGLQVTTISELFSSALFQPQIRCAASMDVNAANQQERERLEEEQELAKRFVEYFLVGATPTL